MNRELEILGDDNFYASSCYEDRLDIDIKKSKGIYYTPKVIVEYIMENTLKEHDIVKNPYLKVLDISCGCGNFLLEAYDVLYNLFEENIYELRSVYGNKYWKIDNIHNHIVSNCIYGADIDNEAIEILKNSLREKDKNSSIDRLNIYCVDSLKENWNNKFDYIVGNPPYIGHKVLDKSYKKYLFENYKEVYKGKADLYFCFYKKIIDILDEDGLACIITPRYFLDSPSGKDLREYMINKIRIEEIIDFLGANIFKNIGIASCILTFSINRCKSDCNGIDVVNNIDIYKLKDEEIKKIESLSTLIKSDKFDYFRIDQKSLGGEWIIVNEKDEKFYNKIKSKCKYTLEDIAVSFQGIITGCDKAFILESDDKRIKIIDDKLLKNWVKNKNISKYIVKDSNYKLIYSNDIEKEEDYKVVLKECMNKYKEKLENRRECKRNIRKWYELQWGREKSLFERVKVMYPYKSKENRFAIDYSNNFSSADVYSFFIKDEYEDEFSYEYLVGILNSSIYDKYFKITAKKMSKKVYDYYPNKVMKIRIFKDDNYEKIEFLSKTIINILINSKDNDIIKSKVNELQSNIDELIKVSLGL